MGIDHNKREPYSRFIDHFYSVIDNAYSVLFIDALFIDALFIDALFIDALFIDALFIDALFIDALFIVVVISMIAIHAAWTAEKYSLCIN